MKFFNDCVAIRSHCTSCACAERLCSFFLIRERTKQESRAGTYFKAYGVFRLPAPKNFALQNSSHRTENFGGARPLKPRVRAKTVGASASNVFAKGYKFRFCVGDLT